MGERLGSVPSLVAITFSQLAAVTNVNLVFHKVMRIKAEKVKTHHVSPAVNRYTIED